MLIVEGHYWNVHPSVPHLLSTAGISVTVHCCPMLDPCPDILKLKVSSDSGVHLSPVTSKPLQNTTSSIYILKYATTFPL